MALCEPILRIYELGMIVLVFALCGQFVAIVALIIRYARVKEIVRVNRKALICSSRELRGEDEPLYERAEDGLDF